MARRKQGYLKDMEPPHIEEIDDAADRLNSHCAVRMDFLRREIADADALLKLLMHKHKLRTHQFDGLRTRS